MKYAASVTIKTGKFELQHNEQVEAKSVADALDKLFTHLPDPDELGDSLELSLTVKPNAPA